MLRQAELPPGVVNIVTGDGRTGAALVAHPGVDKIAFTGSTEVGKAIQRELAGTGKRLTLELGGKAANIVFDDAALDQAVEGIVNGIYFNQGHVCCAGSRLLVQESVAEPLRRQAEAPAWRRCASATRSTRTPTSARSTRGAARARSRSSSQAGDDEGAEIYQPPCRAARARLLVRADGLHRTSRRAYRIAQEEIFGPVLSVLTFRTPDEAVEKANNTPLRPLRRRLDGEGLADPLDGASGCGPASSGRTRSTASTRRRRSAATRSSGFGREGGLHGLAPYLQLR